MVVHRVKIGDILEVPTPSGLAYVQYTHYTQPYGRLIRVLPDFYHSRPVEFSQIARQKELYFVFCPVETLVIQGLLEVVANERVPDTAKNFPPLRKRGGVRPIAKGGGVSHWTILQGEKETRVEKLSPEQGRLSIASSWNLGMLIKRLTERWCPEMDVGLSNSKRALEAGQPRVKTVRHFLYFPTEAAAGRAQQTLLNRSRDVEIKPSAKGKQWLVLVSDPLTTQYSLAQVRMELENLTIELGGEYDGWEMDAG